jgi:hypothetical protein
MQRRKRKAKAAPEVRGQRVLKTEGRTYIKYDLYAAWREYSLAVIASN